VCLYVYDIYISIYIYICTVLAVKETGTRAHMHDKKMISIAFVYIVANLSGWCNDAVV
jgi:hypothetical protein